MEKLTGVLPEIMISMKHAVTLIESMSSAITDIKRQYASYDIEAGIETTIEMPEDVEEIRNRLKKVIADTKASLNSLQAIANRIDGIDPAL